MHIFSLEKRHNGGKKQIWRWQFLLTRIDSSLTVYSSLLEVEGGFSCAIHCASWTCSGFAILLHFVWKKYHLFGINNYLFINVDGCWYIQNQLGGIKALARLIHKSLRNRISSGYEWRFYAFKVLVIARAVGRWYLKPIETSAVRPPPLSFLFTDPPPPSLLL